MLSQKQTRTLARIGLSALCYWMALMCVPSIPSAFHVLAFLPAYLIVGYDVVLGALRGIWNRQMLDESLLITIATVGALATGEYAESVAVMLLYQVGEWFQGYAVGRSRQSIAKLMEICPTVAHLETEGTLGDVDPDEVPIGSVLVVKAGERIPIDGILLSGTGTLDTAALTGESLPQDITAGDAVISGCVNLGAVLRIQTTKAFEDSTVSKILELVENASEKKAKTETFITRFARVYTPVVVLLACLLVLVPSLALWLLPASALPSILQGTLWTDWLHRALIFLVISCPCALVISVPLSFFGGIGGASRAGILIKGATYLETLAKVDTVVFDKTGTLTHGAFSVTQILPQSHYTNETLLAIAAQAESFSTHPLALSIQKAYGKPVDSSLVQNVQEQAGGGILASVDGQTVAVGKEDWVRTLAPDVKSYQGAGTPLYVAIDGAFAGILVVQDTLKENAKEAMQSLRKAGVRHLALLSGDRQTVAQSVADALALDSVHAELLPEGKVQAVEALLQKTTGKLAFVGDGINDAPVLSRADVGIAMGVMGSDAAMEAADVVLMDDNVQKVATAITIARKTMCIVMQNIIFAIGIKVLFLLLGALGVANLWEAVFADVGVCVLAILNAMRALHVGKPM